MVTTQKERSKKWYEKRKNDPVRKRKAEEARMKYRLENKDKFKKYSIVKQEWKQKNPILNIWSNAKYRAKRKGYDFDLEPSDIIIPLKCPYLETELTPQKGKGHLDHHMSLDRIDSSKGYIKGNIEVISYKANLMKQNASKEQLITFSKNVLKKFDKK